MTTCLRLNISRRRARPARLGSSRSKGRRRRGALGRRLVRQRRRAVLAPGRRRGKSPHAQAFYYTPDAMRNGSTSALRRRALRGALDPARRRDRRNGCTIRPTTSWPYTPASGSGVVSHSVEPLSFRSQPNTIRRLGLAVRPDAVQAPERVAVWPFVAVAVADDQSGLCSRQLRRLPPAAWICLNRRDFSKRTSRSYRLRQRDSGAVAPRLHHAGGTGFHRHWAFASLTTRARETPRPSSRASCQASASNDFSTAPFRPNSTGTRIFSVPSSRSRPGTRAPADPGTAARGLRRS